VETLRPTYKLLIGVPGKSNAFAISQKLGLPEYIINEAKDVLSHEDLRFEDVITDLEISRKSLAIEQEKAEEYRKEAQRLKNEAQKQKNKLAQMREKILNEANEKARKILSDTKDEADAIIKEIRKAQREGANANSLDEKRRKLKERMGKVDEKINNNTKKAYIIPEKLVMGDKVKIHSLNTTGVVVNPPDKNGDVLVKAGIMKVTVNIKDLSIDTTEESTNKNLKKFATTIGRAKAQSVAPQIDLRGLLADEAIYKVDKYLDDCYIARVSPVTIIHGKGTGALRAAIQDYLRKNPRVKSYRNGQYGEGEAGVTVVELKQG
jgi:DNA mismatch repair protein MutS2